MSVNDTIRCKRLELCYSEGEVARVMGITIHAYCDMESYTEEITTVTQLKQIRKLVEFLELGFYQLFDIKCRFCSNDIEYNKDFGLARNELIKLKRLKTGLAPYQLGNKIGFYAKAVHDMENDPDFLESWSIELIQKLSDELKIPLQILLKISCKKCNR